MVTNFEKITEELSDDEKRIIMPWIISGLERRTKANPIKAPAIIAAINLRIDLLNTDKGQMYSRLTQPRLRKICNYIRSNGLLPVIATSSGYYTSNDVQEIQAQIQSLEDRANAILKSADGLRKNFLNKQ